VTLLRRLAIAAASAALLCLLSVSLQRVSERPALAQDEPSGPLPVELQIPSLHIDAPIWQVGEDDGGGMESPWSDTAVGWFAPGFVPGQPGNAVIAGHVDWVDHAAVFYYLKNLSPGDLVNVVMDDGGVLSFAVDEVDQYDDTDTPMEQIFGNSDQPHLNLITCGGVFDHSSHNYDHRLVVYTTLVQS